MLRRLFPRLQRFKANLVPVLPTTTTTTTTARLSARPRLSLVRRYPTSAPRPLPPNESVSERLKHLIKSYGWYALGVYLVFSALDFSVAFLGIKLLGAEQVSRAAAYAKQAVLGFFSNRPLEPGSDEIESPAAGSAGHEGLYAMIVLAYTIHKTVFLPVRLGLTAAFTPRIVGWLRARGWAGGEGVQRAAREIQERTKRDTHP